MTTLPLWERTVLDAPFPNGGAQGLITLQKSWGDLLAGCSHCFNEPALRGGQVLAQSAGDLGETMPGAETGGKLPEPCHLERGLHSLVWKNQVKCMGLEIL